MSQQNPDPGVVALELAHDTVAKNRASDFAVRKITSQITTEPEGARQPDLGHESSDHSPVGVRVAPGVFDSRAEPGGLADLLQIGGQATGALNSFVDRGQRFREFVLDFIKPRQIERYRVGVDLAGELERAAVQAFPAFCGFDDLRRQLVLRPLKRFSVRVNKLKNALVFASATRIRPMNRHDKYPFGVLQFVTLQQTVRSL
jgi:hypothetical protein